MAAEGGCTCCSGIGLSLNRRLLLGSGAAAALVPLRQAWAYKSGGGSYEAMLLSCIDPRMHVPVASYMKDRDLTGKYSKFTVAGAAIGVVAPAFERWHQTFWENLAASIELHRIKMLIAIDHRDCGAARIAYGADSIATPQAEDATHRAVFIELRKQLAARHPGLGIETILMDIDGSETPFV